MRNVAVMVNGEPITNYDIEQRSKLDLPEHHKLPDRQQVIDELIDEKVKIREGEEIRHRPFGHRCRSVLRRDELADADHAGAADEIPGEPRAFAPTR